MRIMAETRPFRKKRPPRKAVQYFAEKEKLEGHTQTEHKLMDVVIFGFNLYTVVAAATRERKSFFI